MIVEEGICLPRTHINSRLIIQKPYLVVLMIKLNHLYKMAENLKLCYNDLVQKYLSALL